MKIKKESYNGFDHDKVYEQFEGDLLFVNEFCVRSDSMPCAVYRSTDPNRKKGHKDYLLLYMVSDPYHEEEDKIVVSGMDADEMEKYRHQMGLHCLKCDTVIYSMARHDNVSCDCGAISIDGGRDYHHISGCVKTKCEYVTIDLLTDTIEICKVKDD